MFYIAYNYDKPFKVMIIIASKECMIWTHSCIYNIYLKNPFLTILWSAMMCELQIFIMVILSEPLHGTRLFCSLLVTLCLEIR